MNLSFLLKKFIGGLLLPLPFLLILMGMGIVLVCFTTWQKCAKFLIIVSWLGLILLSLQPVADSLLRNVEAEFANKYEAKDIDKTTIEYIVVLGGGYTFNPDWAPSSNLLSNSLPRVTEAMRQYYAHPNAKLVFTGGYAIGNSVASAEVAAMVAESLGARKDRIIALKEAHDTEEEAAIISKLVGKNPFLLVTSANHLPRALQFFKSKGLNPIPVSANQLAVTSPLNPWEKWIPSAQSLSHSERAWYEIIGSIWQKIKKKRK